MKQSQRAPEARAGPRKTKPAPASQRCRSQKLIADCYQQRRESSTEPFKLVREILTMIPRQRTRKTKMIYLKNAPGAERPQVPAIDADEAEFYAREAAKEAEAFAAVAADACGPGPWQKAGAWLFGRDCSLASLTRALGIEVTFMALMVQAFADRMGIYQRGATPAEREHLDKCVYLMVRALRGIAPDAVRKAMRDDA